MFTMGIVIGIHGTVVLGELARVETTLDTYTSNRNKEVLLN